MSEYVKSTIRDIPNFPKPGIIFKDITTLVKDPKALKEVVAYFTDKLKDKNIDYVAAIESRGFIFGAPIACELDAGLIILRKPGKLPAETEKVTYDLEYGSDSIEIHRDAIEDGKRVALIDDLLATGGTAAAAGQLIEKVGGKLVANCFVVDLTFLNGKDKLSAEAELITMVEY